jgi:rhamnosyltransferase
LSIPHISVVVRTLNEERYLEELLIAIHSQVLSDINCEVVIIDSGSTDRTLDIAKEFKCRITHIDKSDFTFGRSLNWGSQFAQGDYLVYISGHCIPTSNTWLQRLVDPLIQGVAGYSYGGQVGRDTTKFSERQLFKKYFPEVSEIPQQGFFCNNANAAISRVVWNRFKFDEDVTGLEDMELAKRLVESGGSVAYVADASVFHIHDESWRQISRRYERESVALQGIMPEVRLTWVDMWRYIFAAVINDSWISSQEGTLFANFAEIVGFRTAQYFGSYRGNKLLKDAADGRRESYFYPKDSFRK